MSEPAAGRWIAGKQSRRHKAGETHGGLGRVVAEDTENKGQIQDTFWRESGWAVLLK